MSEPREGRQRVFPCLAYKDGPAALRFLRDAFGFEETFRYPTSDGRIGHADLSCQGSALMVASVGEELGQASALDLPSVPSQVYCTADDVDAHYERACERGATVVGEPEDQPDGVRSDRALDPEGHRWTFVSPLEGLELAGGRGR